MNRLVEREGGDRTASRALRFRCTGCGAAGVAIRQPAQLGAIFQGDTQHIECCGCGRVAHVQLCVRCEAPVIPIHAARWSGYRCECTPCPTGVRYVEHVAWD